MSSKESFFSSFVVFVSFWLWALPKSCIDVLAATTFFTGDIFSGYTYRYLTGNPCTEYEGYREYVIATLDNLQWLDGKEIEKSERILAKQVWLLFNPILHI